jgi:hypothetical protein
VTTHRPGGAAFADRQLRFQRRSLASRAPSDRAASLAQAMSFSDLVAVLGGIDFEIRRVGGGDGRRTLLTGNFAEWQWDVRALRSGSLQLDLVLFVRVRDGGDLRCAGLVAQAQVRLAVTARCAATANRASGAAAAPRARFISCQPSRWSRVVGNRETRSRLRSGGIEDRDVRGV